MKRSDKHNEIIGPYSAIVDGETTAFSGCDSDCGMRSRCLRSDSRLKTRAKQLSLNSIGSCRAFTAAEPIKLSDMDGLMP